MNDYRDIHPHQVSRKACFWAVICAVLTIGLPLAFIAADIHSAAILRQGAHDRQAKSAAWADEVAHWQNYTPYPMTGKAY